MGTTRLGVFPSLGNKVMFDMIDKSLVEWIVARFPIDFFSHVYIENQSAISNNYILNKNGELTPVDTAQVFSTPFMRVTVRHGINNHSDVYGTDIWNPNQQPGAFLIDTDLTGYRPIYHDPFGTIIALNERTLKVNFDVTISLQTKSDQIGIMNYLDTFLKMNYVQTIDIPTVIPMHNLLMEYIRSCIFKPEMLALDKSIDGSDEQLEFKKYINKMFMEMMYEYSEGHIKPYKEQAKAKNSEGDSVDTMNYSYCYNQINRIYVKIDKYDADEGNKSNNFYSGFNITFSGNYDFGSPISFITSVPAIIRGTRNNWYLKTSNNTTRDRYYHMLQFKEVYKDDRHLVAVNPNVYQHFYYEKELMMASKTEKFNILDDVISVSECPSHYYIMKALLTTIKDQDDFNRVFKTVIYKKDDPINEKLFTIDEKFNFTIRNCDLSVPYYIDVFISRGEYINRINQIRTILENNGINWWKYFDRLNVSDKSLSWFIKMIRKDFRSYLLNKPAKKYRYDINPYESNSHVERGYRGIGYIPLYKTQADSELEFMTIVSSEFLTVDPQFEYYFLNEDENYIKIDPEDVETMIEKHTFYIKVGKKYVECDPVKILIPDPKYKYYIFDKESNTYVYQENITSFDPIQQYYITKDDYRYDATVNPEIWNV